MQIKASFVVVVILALISPSLTIPQPTTQDVTNQQSLLDSLGNIIDDSLDVIVRERRDDEDEDDDDYYATNGKDRKNINIFKSMNGTYISGADVYRTKYGAVRVEVGRVEGAYAMIILCKTTPANMYKMVHYFMDASRAALDDN